MDENKKIIEINGVRLEVDLRSARRIDEFKVGDIFHRFSEGVKCTLDDMMDQEADDDDQ